MKKINDGLKAIKADGQNDKLFDKYFGGDKSGVVKEDLALDKVALDE